MYHYVREHDPQLPQFRYLDRRNFERQLDYFAANGGFVDFDAWCGFLAGDAMPTGFILTFDDAMRCHRDFAFEILRARGLWGIFYVPTQPYAGGGLLDVHKIHLLTGAFDGRALYGFLKSIITPEMVPFAKREEFDRLTYVTQENYEGVSEFKRILNYFVDESLKSQLIDAVAQYFDYSYPDNFYITPEAIREMAEGGMIMGSHSVSHPVMSKLDREAQKAELEQSFACLEAMTGLRQKTYCHPYGGFHSFNQDTVDLLDGLKVDYAFNVESRDIEPADIVQSRQFLPRYDCNEFPHGKAS